MGSCRSSTTEKPRSEAREAMARGVMACGATHGLWVACGATHGLWVAQWWRCRTSQCGIQSTYTVRSSTTRGIAHWVIPVSCRGYLREMPDEGWVASVVGSRE